MYLCLFRKRIKGKNTKTCNLFVIIFTPKSFLFFSYFWGYYNPILDTYPVCTQFSYPFYNPFFFGIGIVIHRKLGEKCCCDIFSFIFE